MSTATIRPAIIIDACNAYLAARQERIEMDRETLIQWKMQTKRWFRPCLTREEAIQWLKTNGNGWTTHWNSANHTGGQWAGEVRELKRLAVLAHAEGGVVTINGDLAHCLRDSLPKDVA